MFAAIVRGAERLVWALTLWHCLLGALPAGAQEADVPGAGTQPVVDYIETLRARGITVIYGSDLLPESAQMPISANGDRGLAPLEAALRPYGLTLRPGPRGSWLVVQAPAAAADSPAVVPSAGESRVFAPPPLETVVVSASRYAFARAPGPSAARLDRTQLTTAPTLGGDAIRATHGLPGLTSSGLTARVNVRGGGTDESLLYLDGVRLYNPFHLKDFQSLFSGVNPRIVESMSVYTGAYPAEFGDRMSAVIDIESILPSAESYYEIGVSTLTSSVLGSGRFSDGRGGWVASMRRGNLDLLIDAAGTDAGTPQYVDAFGKVEYEIASRWHAFGGLLVLNDKVVLNDVGIAAARADYRDSYVWGGAKYAGSTLEVDMLTAVTDLSSRRNGSVDDPIRSVGLLDDARDFESLSAQVTWRWLIDDRRRLSGGLQWQGTDAQYDFVSTRTDRVPVSMPGLGFTPTDVDAAVSLSGSSRAVWLSYRARIGAAATAEIGLRRDAQTLPDDAQIGPRFSILYDVGDRLSLRAAWGRYFQADGLHELQIGDGLTTLFPAQESEQTVFGIEYLAGVNLSFRIEVYRKEFERLRPRFENLYARVSLLPELAPDRVMIAPLRGEASGVELSIEGGAGEWTWWANVARARTNDVLATGNADRSWEEPWSAKAGLLWAGPRWAVSLAAGWHTGWPISGLTLEGGSLVAGELNGNRLDNFSSLDVRASRKRQLRRGEFEWFVALNNALDSDNPCCIDYDVTLDSQSRPATLAVSTDAWLSVVPTVGFMWRVGTGP